MFKSTKGFTLVELLIVIIILSVLSGIAIPVYLNFSNRAKESAAKTEMSNIANALGLYKADNEDYPSDFNDDILIGYLKDYKTTDVWGNSYVYVSGSDHQTYTLTSYGINEIEGGSPDDDIVFENGNMTLQGKYSSGDASAETTSAPSTTMLTPLGSTFSEITGSIIDLIQDFYDANNRYPRTWGDYVYTDIGLDPDDWDEAYDHIYYSPGGNRVSVKPEAGYVMEVKDTSGVLKILKPDSNWSLVYSMANAKWYYKAVDPLNEIDISTLEVKAQ